MSQLLDIEKANADLEQASPAEIARWAVETFAPHIAISSSFGAESACLLHLATRAMPDIRVNFIDTGFLFPETIEFRDRLVEQLKLNVVVFKKETSHAEFLEKYGKLYEKDPDLCCDINKVEPMRRAIEGLRCWMSGVRADQTAYRSGMKPVELKPNGLYKVAPLLRWNTKQVYDYLQEHGLPMHPLWEKGYQSIGCEPCTAVPGDPSDPRSGRWSGKNKTECGLHTFLDKPR